MITNFKSGEIITENVLCKAFEQKLTNANKPYNTLTVCDRSGSIVVKDWNCCCPDTMTGTVVRLHGCVVEYNGELQVKLISIESTDLPCEDFCPVSRFSPESMIQSLMPLLDSVEDVWCKKLILRFLNDDEFMSAFSKHSAAKAIHHDYVHGLLEHTLYVTKLSAVVGKIYSSLNSDLLITAAFLHDVGKLKELSAFPENSFTDFGNYVGHVTGSAMIVNAACDSIPDFPEDARLKILHCILAHHGKLEYGSPKLPVIPEALVISEMDNLDAKLKIFEKNCGEGWSPFVRELGVCVHDGQFQYE